MARVRITKLPKALSGLEMKMSAGLYGKGTNGNPQFRKSSYLEAGKISQQPTEVRDTLQPVAREGANLEAEKGETAMVNIDGIPAHFKIGGKRHSEGGTPLNLPDNSFIFSDTAKMKIKDPIMLAQFGMVPKKAGYTPAEIAKKYDINKFRQVLADPNTTDLERKTAEMMIANYNMKLAKLALLQESSKGFPQGIPVVAMPYIMATGMNPEEFAQMDTQGEEEQPDADMGVSRYGGILKAQKGAVQDSVKHQARRTLLYEKGDPKNPNTGGGYDKGKAFGLADYGYHESQKVPGDPSFTKPSTLQQATDKFMEEVDPRNASYFPMALTRGQANDFLFSTGRDIRPYIVDQLYKEKYGKPEGVPNRSQYNVDTKNVRDSKGKLRYPGKKEFTKDIENRIDSLWNANLPQWNQLSYDQQQALMGLGRQSYGRSINRGPGEPNENLEQYKEVWHGRIPNLNSANYDKEIWWDQNHRYGGNIISQFDTKAYGGVQYTEDGLPMGQNGFDPTTLGGWGAGVLNVLEAPQRAMMYGLTGTAGLLSGKGWTGEYEMPSETIRRNFPGHPGLEFAADLLADPFLVSGVAKTIARSGLKKTIAKEAADLAMKDVNKKLTGYEVTRLALRNAAAKSKDVIAGKKTVDEVAKSYETAANLARLDAAFKAAEKVKASKKFANANLAKQATMVENQAIKAVGKVAQKQATGKIGEVAKTAAMLPIAGVKAVGKGIAKVAPPLAEGARYVGKKAVEAAENIGSANVQPLLFPATRIAGTGSKQLVYQDKISEAESRAQEAEAKVQQLQQQIAQPKKPAYGKIISGSIGAMGPGSIARQNLATGDVEWFDQRTGKPWEQVVKQRVQPKPKDIEIKTKPASKKINLDEYQEVTE